MGLASLYEKQKNYKPAISFYRNAIEGSKNQEDKRCQLHCYVGLGRIYLESHELVMAYKNLEAAKKIAKKLKATLQILRSQAKN